MTITRHHFVNGRLVSSDATAVPPAATMPATEWPLWARSLKKLAKPEDKGIGDVVARTIGQENSDAFKKWYKAIFGKGCGCSGRQTKWNRLYPLDGL